MYHSSPGDVERKLAAYTGHPGYVDATEGVVAPLQPALAQAPTRVAWWLCALNFEPAPLKEFAIVCEGVEPHFCVSDAGDGGGGARKTII